MISKDNKGTAKPGIDFNANAEYAAFERLSPELRAALRQVPFNMSAIYMLQLQQQGVPNEAIIQLLTERQRELCNDGWMLPQEIRPVVRLKRR